VSAAAIIGVGPGLGSALARRFAAGGFDLLLLNRSRPPMQAVVAELSRSSTRVDIRQVDVTDRAAVVAAMTAGAAQLGPIAVLIFNAIGVTPEPVTRVNVEALRHDLDVAVLGAVTAVQTAMPSLAETVQSGAAATILITGGGVALYPSAAAGTLPITKAAQRALTFALADEVKSAGIRVATVTINGTIGRDAGFTPDRIADTFWTVHTQPADKWQTEIVFNGVTTR
jgi:NADP-dependent 3-hydroxy acid dehydrogenase YdfG